MNQLLKAAGAVAVLLSLALLPTTAAAGSLVGIAFGGPPTELLDIDKATGQATPNDSLNIFGAGLAYDPGRGLFYAADPASDTLWGINAQTHQVTELLTGYNFNSVAFDPVGDTIYVGESTLASETLYAVDAQSFAVQNLGDPLIGTIYALGFNTDDQRLYAVGPGVGGFSGDGDFVRFTNPMLDATDWTLVSELHEQSVRLVTALAYDEATGDFFASATNEPFRSLITIDPTTGVATTVGSFGIGNDSIRGLAVVPVPEPAGAILVAVVAVGLASGRRTQARRA